MSQESDKLAAHQANVVAAHGKFQVAMAAAATEAARKAAHVQRHKDILASARANGIKTGAHEALHNLGVSPDGDSGQSGDA